MSVSCDANKFNSSSVYYLGKDTPIGPDVTVNNLAVIGTTSLNGELTSNSNITATNLSASNRVVSSSDILCGRNLDVTGILNVGGAASIAGNLLATSLGGAFAGTTTGIDINGSIPINQQTINMVIGNTLIQGGLHVTSPTPSAVIGNITFARPYSAPPVIIVSALNQQSGGTPIRDYANWGIANLIPLTVGFQLLGTNAPANGLATWLCIGPV